MSGELTFKLIQEYVDDIVAVDEDEIASALLSLLEKQNCCWKEAAQHQLPRFES